MRPSFPFAILLVAWCTTGAGLAIDSDADGMSDVWQAAHSIASADALLDPDNDGYTNRDESALRSDPADANSPGALVEVSFVGETLTLSVHSTAHVRYQPQRSYDGEFWFNFPAVLEGDGGALAYDASPYAPAAGAKLSVRVLALPPVDADGDGLDAGEEAALGLSDANGDSDGDLVPDGEEYALGLDPKLAADSDNDLLPDDWERFYHGGLAGDGSADGDVDGLTDAEELAWALDPTAADTDANGFGDSYSEALIGHWPFDELWADGAGATFTADASGFARHGEVAGARFEPTGGRTGGAFSFSGAGDSIEIEPAILDGAGDVTIAMWVKLPTASEAAHRAFLEVADSANVNELLIRYDTGTAPGFDTDELQFFTGETAASAEVADGSALFQNTWRSIVYVRDDTSDMLSLYIDGVKIWTKSTTLSPLSLGADAWFTIGGQRSSSAGGIEEGVDGMADDIWLWTRALSEVEVGGFLSLIADGDDDGLADHMEVALGTNALVGDSDGDGLGDAYELATGTDPGTAETPAPTLATKLEVYTPTGGGAN